MSDIVKRARDYARNLGGPPEDYLVWHLADEIDRLRDRYDFQVNANRSLVEATGKAMDLVAEAAAVLDRMADHVDTIRTSAVYSTFPFHGPLDGRLLDTVKLSKAAADCRAMAKKLRGKP